MVSCNSLEINQGNKAPLFQVVLIRHGETQWNAKGLYQGQRDISLNDAGRKQAEQAGYKLMGIDFRRIYTSPLCRAVETAAIVRSISRSGPLVPLPGLRELNFGRWEGLSFSQVQKLYPKEVEKMLANPEEFQPTAGEKVSQFKERVLWTWKQVFSWHPMGKIVLVTHGGPIRVLLEQWTGYFWEPSVPPGSSFLVTFGGTQVEISNLA